MERENVDCVSDNCVRISELMETKGEDEEVALRKRGDVVSIKGREGLREEKKGKQKEE